MKKILGCTLALSFAGALTFAAGGAHAQGVPRAAEEFPSLRLSAPDTAGGWRGEQAIRALGASLPAVARWYGMSTDRLGQLLRNDAGIELQSDGRLVFVDRELPRPLPPLRAAAAANQAAPYPLERTFALHSLPGSKRTLYLNFVGGEVRDTNWNRHNGLPVINAVPYDKDNNLSDFSAAERADIQRTWQRVAEDFAPFDVDVTTEPPALDQLTRDSREDDTFGITVMISRDWTASRPKPCQCAGIAVLSVFDAINANGRVAWAFYEHSYWDDKIMAEVISHEAGHTAGLLHDAYDDGSLKQNYYWGHGSGITGWAPVMGGASYQPVTQWSKGEYPYATEKQDDYLVMAANGLPIRADDHHAALYNATPLTWSKVGDSYQLSATGIVTSPEDVDTFSFYSGAGSIALSVQGAPLGSNLDARARLFDGGGRLLASSSPADSLDANINYVASAPGHYYLKVDGVGFGTLETGYSDYGSLGQYRIAGSVPSAAGNLPPVARIDSSVVNGVAPLSVRLSAAGSFDPEGSGLTYRWLFGDGSPAQQSVHTEHIYTQPGSYLVRLNVWDAQGLRGSAFMTVTVSLNLPPVAVMRASVTGGLAPLKVEFSGEGSSEPNGEALTYQWDFGDGSAPASGARVTYLYTLPGSFPVTLTVRDPQGLAHSAAVRIEVPNQAPLAVTAALPTDGLVPLRVAFSSRGSGDPERESLSYEWDFGDGVGTSTAVNPIYTYATPGSYRARLTVRDARGASTSSALSIEARANPALTQLHVEAISMSLTGGDLQKRAMARVKVTDGIGRILSGARVLGQWSGIVSGSVEGITAADGAVKLYSPWSVTPGNFVFSVTGVSLSGMTHNPGADQQSSAGVQWRAP